MIPYYTETLIRHYIYSNAPYRALLYFLRPLYSSGLLGVRSLVAQLSAFLLHSQKPVQREPVMEPREGPFKKEPFKEPLGRFLPVRRKMRAAIGGSGSTHALSPSLNLPKPWRVP